MTRHPRFRKAMQEDQRHGQRQHFANALADPQTKSVGAAARKAGYSRGHGYEIRKQPQFQNMLTDALKRGGLTPARLAKPLLDGLDAKVVVKHSESLSARATEVPDLEFRGKTVDRITHLYGLGARHQDDTPPQAPTPIFNFIRVEAPTHTPHREEIPDTPPAITATFTREE